MGPSAPVRLSEAAGKTWEGRGLREGEMKLRRRRGKRGRWTGRMGSGEKKKTERAEQTKRRGDGRRWKEGDGTEEGEWWERTRKGKGIKRGKERRIERTEGREEGKVEGDLEER